VTRAEFDASAPPTDGDFTVIYLPSSELMAMGNPGSYSMYSPYERAHRFAVAGIAVLVLLMLLVGVVVRRLQKNDTL
jgi:hypothetical protein